MRATIATGAGKIVSLLSRRLNLGGGTAYPGEVALWIDPRLLQKLAARLPEGCLVVTGTNGKTTTSRLISNILGQVGLAPVHNRSGANLLDGVASALLNAGGLFGRPAGGIGVFEIDEANLPQAIAETRPRAVVITNLFRDQLDRYGEIDQIAALWRRALAGLPPTATVILNADDPVVAGLGTATPARVLYYGLEDSRHGLPGRPQAADSTYCLTCGAPYHYQVTYYAHIGKYACPRCGATRPQPAVYVEDLRLRGSTGSEIGLALPQGKLRLGLSLPGLYNVYNALAALACGTAFDIPAEALKRGIETFSSAFGRIERVDIDGKQALLALVKNPVGFNEVLRMLLDDGAARNLLIVINDRIADGTDISWLWDVDFELLPGRVSSLTVAGTRAEDMQLRLKYAGVDMARVGLEKDLRAALDRGLRGLPEAGTLYLLPTYTAMLEIRQMLHGMGHVREFWRD